MNTPNCESGDAEKNKDIIIVPLFVDEIDREFWLSLTDKDRQAAIIAARLLKCSFSFKKSNIYMQQK